MTERSVPYRRLAERLRAFGAAERPDRGKGSHRYWGRRMADGRTAYVPVPFHGSGTDVGRGIVRSVRRALELTPQDGVSDREFYGD